MNSVAVAISGLGAVSPLGLSLDETFDALLQARSAIAFAPASIVQHLPTALAACVPPAFDEPRSREDAGHDRCTQLALAAARQALADAAFVAPDDPQDRVGVFVGTGLGGVGTTEAVFRRVHGRLAGIEAGPAMSAHPLSVPRIMPNAAAAALSMERGFRGPSLAYSVGCASSAVALGEAWRTIRHGYADAVLVVGAESFVTVGSFAAWQALRAMALPDPQDVAASCKPFDRRRSGFVLGEGAAAVLLERADLAAARGRRPHALLLGYGNSSDAHHLTQPQAAGQARAIRMALAEAAAMGVGPDHIGYVNAHGTATPAGDAVEIAALREAFGTAAAGLQLSSTKSMHGHLVGAAGALEFAVAIKALVTGSIPPTAHLTQPDLACDLDCVPLQARHGQRLRAVMSNSFAFGGSNACLIAGVCAPQP
jgi:3-oxoacyl-[acyl-carrier-protein] synthase II